MFNKLISKFRKEDSVLEEPQFMSIDKGNAKFKKATEDARSIIDIFKMALENLPQDVFACVKFYIPESQNSESGANIWLTQPFFESGSCLAQPFELPEEFTWIKVGQWLKFPEEDILDWYLLSDDGDLQGGFSLRCQREFIPIEKQTEYDERIGVKNYL